MLCLYKALPFKRRHVHGRARVRASMIWFIGICISLKQHPKICLLVTGTNLPRWPCWDSADQIKLKLASLNYVPERSQNVNGNISREKQKWTHWPIPNTCPQDPTCPSTCLDRSMCFFVGIFYVIFVVFLPEKFSPCISFYNWVLQLSKDVVF